MNWLEIQEAAKNLEGFKCRVCKECNGVACRGELPGMGGKDSGRSFIRNFEDWHKMAIDMSVLYDNKEVDTSITFLGKEFKMPIFIAPMGALTMNYGVDLSDREYADYIVRGSQAVGSLAFTGDGLDKKLFTDPIEVISQNGGLGIPTCKPWAMNEILERLYFAKEKGVFAMAMDIDAAGLPFIISAGTSAGAKSKEQMESIIGESGLPFIVKGIMTAADARTCVEVGAQAIVVSNHGGRVLDLCPSTCEILSEIVEEVKGEITILVDGGIRSGMNVFMALALGADAVLIGRPVGLAAYGGRQLGNGAEGVATYLNKIHGELVQTMKMTGCTNLEEIWKKRPIR